MRKSPNKRANKSGMSNYPADYDVGSTLSHM